MREYKKGGKEEEEVVVMAGEGTKKQSLAPRGSAANTFTLGFTPFAPMHKPDT